MKTKTNTEEDSEPLTKSTNEFPVIGVGASAGGLDAFRKLLEAIPENSEMAFVLVQHLDPNHESLLPEILQKLTKIPVQEITDDIKVAPNNIYIIPSNKILIADDGVLKLTVRPAKGEGIRNMPIDLFFSSLAEVHQSHSIAVVLSGTGNDGTQGLKAIKDYGGITFAQDEASAGYDGMPTSAIAEGVVDFVLSPKEIVEKLVEINKIIHGSKNGEDGLAAEQTSEEVYKHILSLLRIRKGIDFTYYKKTTIQRRILRRMALNKNEEADEYLKFLRENKTEQDILYQDFLISVTTFFRDKKSWENLCEMVFPQILKSKTHAAPVRIWVTGCSTGQEAYTMAMCFKEYNTDNNEKIQIFASDISEPAIAKARAGLYNEGEVEQVSAERLKRFFTKTEEGYQVNKEVRDLCVFAHHNFLKDPPFGKMDLISCRNVLIYMDPYLQKKALTTFHYALNTKGFLLLGKSETIGSVPDLFVAAVKNDKLFLRKDVPGKFQHSALQDTEQRLMTDETNPQNNNVTDYLKIADEVIRKNFMPAGVIVNEAFDIVNFKGNTNDYLAQTSGKPSHNLLKMARHGLAFELRNILHKVKKENTSITEENIYLTEGLLPGQAKKNQPLIAITAIPLNTVEPHYLILFLPQPATENREDGVAQKNDKKDLRIQQLEQQLLQAYEDMRSITEEQDAANEELQSANEELLSSSEELQSLNEELETSKEELQSTNEELTVMNQETLTLNEQVTIEKNFSQAIVATIHDALLVLDKNFKVISANNTFYKQFAVTPDETEGASLFKLGSGQWNIPILQIWLEEIVPKNKQVHDFEVTHNFPKIGEKIMLLNANRIIQPRKNEELILLSIKDVTEEVRIRKDIEFSENRFHNLIYSSPSAMGILHGEDLVITIANEAIIEIWGKGNTIVGKKYFEALPELVEQGYKEVFNKVYKTGIPFSTIETPVKILQQGIMTLKYYNFILFAQRNINDEINGVGIIASEVTSQAELNNKIKESEQHFRLMADLMPAKISNAKANGEVTYFNKQWLDFSGYSFEELKDFGYHKILHPDEIEDFQDRLKHAATTGTVLEMEMRLMDKNGNYKWHLNLAAPIIDDTGNIKMWIGVTTDINDQKEKEEEKDSFISIASHELKTPLTTAKAYLQMLEFSLDPKEEEANLFAKKASQSVNRLNELITELLDVSKIEFGKLNYTNTTFSINDMIKSTVQNMQLTSPTHSLIITGRVNDEIIGDKERLQQVVINLLSNAIKYSPGEEKVFINIGKENGNLKISIKDTGIGIAKQSLNKIFDKYHRIEEHAAHFQGLGIGLFISYEIIQRHNGKLWAESEDGKGSTFYFTLPVNSVLAGLIEEANQVSISDLI